MSKPFVVVSCPLDTFSGYGSRSRDVVRALLKSEKYDVKVLSQRWGTTPYGFLDENDPEDKKLLDCIIPSPLQRQPDVWIQITVPNEFQKIGKFSIGITAGIETDICTHHFIEGCNRMDLILGSSNHTVDVFKRTQYDKKDKEGKTQGMLKLETPVDILIEGLDLEKYYHIEPSKLPQTQLVKSLNEIDEQFCFLFVGHWLQGAIGEDRKNVGLMLKTFLETFKNKSKRPALVMKTMSGGASIMDREEILKRIDAVRKGVSGTLPNVYLLHGEIEDKDMNHLYNHPKIKAMVSLTKGEGFGRPLLEFTQSKKPVIASNWSGHLDFLNSDFASLVPGELKEIDGSAVQKDLLIEKSKWFSPDINFVSLLLKDYVNGYKQYQVNGKRLGYYCKTNFSFDIMQQKLEEVLDKNAPKKVEIKLPNIKKISLPKKDV
jgi:glycosyltransferase involved in cell wall biosynthesis